MSRPKFAVSLAAMGLCSLALAVPAQAGTVGYTVDDLDDTANVAPDSLCDAPGLDTCTLREAIMESNSEAGSQTILFSVNGTINTSGAGTLTTTGPTVIDGNGPANTIVDGGDAVRLFFVNGAAATFKDIQLEDGGLTGNNGGAAIMANANVTVDNAVVTSNQITGVGNGSGAGIYGAPATTITVTNSTISNNTMPGGFGNGGGGIYADGALAITDSAVSGNSVTGGTNSNFGGGIYSNGALTVERTSVSGNTVSGAAAAGAGIFAVNPGTRTILNSTISGNTGTSSGGGGVHAQGGTYGLTNVTFASNTGGSGAGGQGDDVESAGGATVTAQNSIFASSLPCNAPGSTIQSQNPGHNIDTGTSCGFGTTQGNMESTSPQLVGPNQAGVPPRTVFIPLATSPAIDTADPSCGGGLTVDQRGVSRPQGPACDIGAYERDYRDLTVLITGSGSVTGTGINCINGAGDCAHEFLDGSAGFVLTATPAAGFQFASWSHAGGCLSVTSNQCTVDTGNDRTITANFTALPPTGGGTTITPTISPTPAPAPPKKCKKGRKLKKGKCVKKKKKK